MPQHHCQRPRPEFFCQLRGNWRKFTRQFPRLRDGGVLAQWMPLEQQSDRLNRMLLAAMAESFRYVALYMPGFSSA